MKRNSSTAAPVSLAQELGKTGPFDSPEQEAFLQLARTHAVLAAETEHLFKEHGISAPQYNALRILRGEGRPMQVYQIAERMVTPQTDITRLVDRLEAAGFVGRERCGEDRRVVWVALTTAGKSVVKKLDRPVAELHKQQFAHVSRRDVEALSQVLFRVRHPGCPPS